MLPRAPVGGSPRQDVSLDKPDSIMNSARSDFLHVARERGYIHQTTEEGAFLARLQAGPLAGYIGFDATADSLHVGSLVQIMLLRLMQQTGNRPVVLMGGGTTKVGDPSFRDEAAALAFGCADRNQ
jgi:tyrosyl-tRNA synthetase